MKLLNYTALLLPLTCHAATFNSVTYDTCFTPQQNCTAKIVTEIDTAKSKILVQAYSFTSIPIITSLIAAKNRGVDVKILLDKSQKTAKYLSVTYLTANKMWYRIDYKPAIAHNKIIVVDDNTVITGSFNFTKAAQFKNAENVLIIHDKNLAATYKQNWSYRESQT